jgi:uncharacterized protein (DUF302 family)
MATQRMTSLIARRRRLLKTIAAIVAAMSPTLLSSSRSEATEQGVTTMSGNGLEAILSAHGAKDTIDRMEREVRSEGMTVFARIDHAAGAKEAGFKLAPTELLIFGSARAGTPLMQARQQFGIDLPLKVLAWEDASGRTWLCYNDPAWLAKRHGLGHEADKTIEGMTASLRAIATKVTA